MEILYFKAPRMVNIIQKKRITVGDLGDLQGKPELVHRAKKLPVVQLRGGEKERKLVSVLDVIQVIQQEIKGVLVVNLGSADVVVSYKPRAQQKTNFIWSGVKTIAICGVLFFGAMFAIMTFHTDAAVPDVFVEINRIFTGREEQRPIWLIGSYAVGLTAGSGIFFNHFSKKRLSDDPTPVEVEFADYEKKVEECLQEMLSDEVNFGQGELAGSTEELQE